MSCGGGISETLLKPAIGNLPPDFGERVRPFQHLPMERIAGVTFEKKQGVIIALGNRLYDKKELLKAAGFQWDKSEKAWQKKAA